jgi:hypothetical protein
LPLLDAPDALFNPGDAGDRVGDHSAGNQRGGARGSASSLTDDLALFGLKPGHPILQSPKPDVVGML